MEAFPEKIGRSVNAMIGWRSGRSNEPEDYQRRNRLIARMAS